MNWLKTTRGKYINLEDVSDFHANEKSEYINVVATMKSGEANFVANFTRKADAQLYLDRLMKKLGTITEVNMEDWNYTGHKKGHKETRHGGS